MLNSTARRASAREIAELSGPLAADARRAVAEGRPVYFCDARNVDLSRKNGNGWPADLCAACGAHVGRAGSAPGSTATYHGRPLGDDLCAACTPAYGGAVVLPERRRRGRRY